MTQRLLISALSVALMGLLVLLSVAAFQRLTETNTVGASRSVAAVSLFGERQPGLTVPEVQFETEWDGLTDSEWAAIDRTVGRIRSNLLESINDEFQGALDAEIQDSLMSPDELSRRGLDELNRYRQGPDRPTIPDASERQPAGP
jgi:hypothetical protein